MLLSEIILQHPKGAKLQRPEFNSDFYITLVDGNLIEHAKGVASFWAPKLQDLTATDWYWIPQLHDWTWVQQQLQQHPKQKICQLMWPATNWIYAPDEIICAQNGGAQWVSTEWFTNCTWIRWQPNLPYKIKRRLHNSTLDPEELAKAEMPTW